MLFLNNSRGVVEDADILPDRITAKNLFKKTSAAKAEAFHRPIPPVQHILAIGCFQVNFRMIKALPSKKKALITCQFAFKILTRTSRSQKG